LVLRELPGELVVYDTRAHRAHCLNETAARVFRSVDGRRSPAEIGAELARGGVAQDDTLVRVALDELAQAGLVEPGESSGEEGAASHSRRALLQRAAAGAGLLLPAIASIVAPTPAEAATCLTSCIGVSDPLEFDGLPCKCVAGAATCGTCASGTCSGGGGCP
jgi:hypothetical protein